jgi:hypothetical protein
VDLSFRGWICEVRICEVRAVRSRRWALMPARVPVNAKVSS